MIIQARLNEGFYLKTMIFNELKAHIDYQGIGGELFYWRTQEGTEIDFIWKRASKIIALEVKSTTRWKDQYQAGF